MTFRTGPDIENPSAEAKNPWGQQTTYRKVLHGDTWVTCMWPAGYAYDVLPKLVALSSGPISMVVGVVRSMMSDEGVMAGDVSGAEVREGLLALSRELVTQGGSELLKDLLQNTQLQASPDKPGGNAGQQFDLMFQGRLGLAIELVMWVLEVNLRPLASVGRGHRLPSRLIQMFKPSQPESKTTPHSSTSGEADNTSGSESPGNGKRPSRRSRRRGR